jgi:glyoxylase-like metal-dependent hydrolase (beta-lactamase superfamily II)
VNALRSGLWHWRTPHPGWTPDEPWGEQVSSYAVDDGDRLLVFDPLGVPDELEALAREREPAIVLTSPWHERDAERLVERLGWPVFAPPADTAEDLMRKFDITAEQAGDGSPDLAWLRASESDVHYFGAGDLLPIGVEAFLGREANDLVLWLESRVALVTGDTLADFGGGLEIVPGWLPAGVTREAMAERLRPLLELPVELVLPAHGEPADRGALEQALV